MPLFNPPYIPDLFAPNQTQGDVIYYTGTKWERLPIGVSGSYLYTSGSGLPVWQQGLTGSLQRLSSGQTYLAAGANVTIVTQSNGQVVISTSATGSSGAAADTVPYSNDLGELFFAAVTQSVYRKATPVTTQNGWLVNDYGLMLVTTSSVDVNYLTAGTVYSNGAGADISASYIVVGLTSSLPNERALNVGTGLLLADSGAGTAVTVSANNNVLATITGSQFSGPVIAAGGLTGSLQKTSAGLSYLVGGQYVTVTSSSNEQVIIAATNPTYNTVPVDLGVSRRSGHFDITGSSGLTAGKVVNVFQSAGQILSKGSATDELEMDPITAVGYVVDSSTIRVYWNCPSVVVGVYEFAYLVSS